PHDLGVDDWRTIVGEGDGPALDKTADLGQFLALATLGDGADGEDIGVAGALGLEMNELRGSLRVDGRLGVGHARYRRDTAGQRRGGAGGDGLVLLAARLAQVDVHVDQARADDQAVRVERAVSAKVRLRVEANNAAIVNPQVGDLIDSLGRV